MLVSGEGMWPGRRLATRSLCKSMAANEGDITQLLKNWSGGDPDALGVLVPQVYGELHRIAQAYFGKERVDHTLEPTALVHEAFLQLVQRQRVDWQDRSHFYRLSAHVMRCILVDHARRRDSVKRGGHVRRVPLEEALFLPEPASFDLVALDEALEELAKIDPGAAEVVEMRFFIGLSYEEIAEHLDRSPRTIRRKWTAARLWLFRLIEESR